ncbi:DeoR/GlpR family DNA-binding transcription regulator [Bacillus horti]|uniref:DeoR/GlpR family transcriptional regulator of sugar metabolism n=1 Tax=Caldalkalibacillus horti TaxID=77523 RepID=A0ABT9W2X0_9BACI|nr:DeoR/GlpR family DNA-binding transcription regulator [Bacillus horti]MDQ0167419.1 DeoR/GlpR family transcriptional regulator of sugar metabolism [Bacillus horti]
MFAEERKEKIKKLIITQGRVEVKELADQLKSSIHTIRRDLSALEEEGVLSRTHGGAVLTNKVRMPVLKPEARYTEGTEHQHAIARKAASVINAGSTIYIGGSSTERVMLQYLPELANVTVVTNSLEIAVGLRGKEGYVSYLTGGQISTSGNFTDSLALDFLSSLNIDLAFIVGSGLTAKDGLTTSDPNIALFQRKVLESADRSICLANHYKVGTKKFSQIAKLTALGHIITDSLSSENELEQIRNQGVSIEIA